MLVREKKSGLFFCIFCFLVLIFDSAGAVHGAKEGITLCMDVLIPSLFPLFVLTAPLTDAVCGKTLLPFFARFLHIPMGSEGILLTGILGGYPMGASAVGRAYEKKCLTRKDAERFLLFSSFAGPAFLFGVASRLWEDGWAVWALWAVHILASLLIAHFTPGNGAERAVIPKGNGGFSIQRPIRAMAAVCGWVILFKILLTFCDRWFLWLFPKELQILFSGTLELSNGFLLLRQIENAGCRFVIASGILGFGGICVLMQTSSVICDLSVKPYFFGKVLHGIVSAALSYFIQYLLFPQGERWGNPVVSLLFLGLLGAFFILRGKKTGYSRLLPV